jgi:hypothetical protein
MLIDAEGKRLDEIQHPFKLKSQHIGIGGTLFA